MANNSDENNQPSVPRDFRAVVVAVTGLVVILVAVVVGIIALPGPVSKTEVDNTSQNTVAIASAAFTAVAAVVSAYFGIKATNVAREESTKSAKQSEIIAGHLAGAPPDQAGAALDAATKTIKELGLA
jgi:hypothetical protein